MFDGVKEDHSLELANLLRSGQFSSLESAQRGFRSLPAPDRSIPPPLPTSDPPISTSSGRNSRLAFLENLSASEESHEENSISSSHSGSTASLSSKHSFQAPQDLGLINQAFKQEEESPRNLKDEKGGVSTIPESSHQNGSVKVGIG